MNREKKYLTQEIPKGGGPPPVSIQCLTTPCCHRAGGESENSQIIEVFFQQRKTICWVASYLHSFGENYSFLIASLLSSSSSVSGNIVQIALEYNSVILTHSLEVREHLVKT